MAVALDIADGESSESETLGARCAQQLGIAQEEIVHLDIARRALDARRRGRRHELRFVYHADVTLAAGHSASAITQALKAGRAREIEPAARFELEGLSDGTRARRIVVVGAGPAGLYAAWTLAANGVAVDLIDRGPGLRERGRAVARFNQTREADPERNLLFGEGGAGTYSDGKLYTRTQHPLEGPILDTLVDAGADPMIRFDARAHVGTDRLHRILPKLRERLSEMGVRFFFDTKLEGLVTSADGVVVAAETSSGEMECDGLVLALGHSARDTLRALYETGDQERRQSLVLEAKPFQIGLRIEHPQALIDAGRFGEKADLTRLGHAYYTLVAKATKETGAVHSFCMCPGGQIVAAVSQPGLLCTNGMSNSKHSSPFANSGLVVTLGPREFGEGVFAGVRFQEQLEAQFFQAGGGDYSVPTQRVQDFLAGRGSSTLSRTSYKLGAASVRIDELLPPNMTTALRAGIERFDRQLPGYAGEEGMLVGIESRSSGPIRIPPRPDDSPRDGIQESMARRRGRGLCRGHHERCH